MVRRILSLFTAAAMLATSLAVLIPAIAFAGTQGSCDAGDTSKIRLWENSAGDTSDGNDSLWKCGNDSDLGNDDHTLSGDCNRPLPPAGNWNDCVSSFTVYVPSGWKLCLYQDAGYSTLKATYVGTISGLRYDAGATWDDKLSSFKFTTGSC